MGIGRKKQSLFCSLHVLDSLAPPAYNHRAGRRLAKTHCFQEVSRMDKERARRLFLTAFFLFALANGLSGSIISNYFKDVFQVDSVQRGLLEIPRELPGVVGVFVIAALPSLGNVSLSVLGFALYCVGLLVLGLFSPGYFIMQLFVFTYSLGGTIYNYSELYMAGSTMSNQYRYMLEAWHPVRNPQSNLPRAGAVDVHVPSDLMIYDASYIRLKNITVGYTFDLSKRSKFIRDITLNLSAENLHIWKKYNGFDPDVSTDSGDSALRRVDLGAYPKPRTIVFSIQLRY